MIPKNDNPHSLALAGMSSNATAAAHFESELVANPDDLNTHTKLLGYYMQRSFTDAGARRHRAAHCCWVIRNHPDSKIAGLPFCRVERILEAALDLLTTDEDRFYMLTHLAPIAVDAAHLRKAVLYADELLNWTRKFRTNWNHGNAIHLAHVTLGRVALRQRRIEVAKTHLIASAKTKGSPQLNSFGPNHDLAAELLARGEAKIAIRYLNLCRKFWTMGGQRIDAWTKSILASGTTDFMPVFDTEESNK